MKLTTHLRLVLRLRLYESITSHPCAFVAVQGCLFLCLMQDLELQIWLHCLIEFSLYYF